MKLANYHIIIVPPDAQKTRRLHLSSLTARLLVLLAVVALPVAVGSLFAAAHYQDKLAALRQNMSEERQILEQKEVITGRLSILERSLSKAEHSLAKLEGALDIELGEMETGLGPIVMNTNSLTDGGREIPLPEDETFDEALEKGKEISFRALRGRIDHFDAKMDGLQAAIDEIYELNRDKIRFLEATPNLMPVNGWITSGFGFRRAPYSGAFKMHYGLDIASPYGSAVRAPADGKVIIAEYKGGYGREVIIDHGYGVTTTFAHASALFVKEGDKVKRGDIIATVGTSGSSTGPHLHYEVHVDGIPTDPLMFVMK